MKKTAFTTGGTSPFSYRHGMVLIFADIFFSGCQDHRIPEMPDGSLPMNVLYIENNVPVDNQNAILAYRRGADGTLTTLGSSPFVTGGKGVSNPTQKLGPNDSDQCIAKATIKKVIRGQLG